MLIGAEVAVAAGTAAAFLRDAEPADRGALEVTLGKLRQFLLEAGRVNALRGDFLVADLECTGIHQIFRGHEALDLIGELLDLHAQLFVHLLEFGEFLDLCDDSVGCDDHSDLFLPHCAVGA